MGLENSGSLLAGMGTLLDLQEGLKLIKQEWGSQLRLKKCTKETSPHAPFPVSLVLHPDTPDSCSLFDQLEDLALRATIKQDLIEMSSGGAPAPVWQAVDLAVESNQLPSSLNQAMTVELRRKVSDGAPSFCMGAAAIRIVLQTLRKSFSMLLADLPELLTMKPELLETYESVGATGHSERRIKFVMSLKQEAEPESVQDRSPNANQLQAQEPSADEHVQQHTSDAEQLIVDEDKQLHPAITKVIKLLAARFPDLSVSKEIADATSTSSAQFTVSVTPSDANWLHGSLQCSGVVALSAPASCGEPNMSTPAQSSQRTSVSRFEGAVGSKGQAGKLQASRKPHVPAGRSSGPGMDVTLKLEPGNVIDVPTCAVVNHLLSKEAAVVAGKSDALRLMLKHAETHLATMVHSSWDLLISTTPNITTRSHNGPHSSAHRSPDDSENTKMQANNTGGQDTPPVDTFSNGRAHEDHSDHDHEDEDEQSFDTDSSRSSNSEWHTEQVSYDQGTAVAQSEAEGRQGDEMYTEGDTRDTHGGLGEAGAQQLGSRTVAVSMDGLGMQGTSCLEALRLCFQVACLRCTKPTQVTFSSVEVTQAQGSQKVPKLALSQACEKCSQDMCITVAPHLVHTTSNVLCHLRVDGCAPVDLLPCWFGAQCDSCGALAAMRHVQAGSNVTRECGKCHQRLSVTYTSASFQRTAAPSAAASRGSKGGHANKGGPGSEAQRRASTRDALTSALDKLQVGQPLPLKGTCKHYGHSHRWLRFPCCGLRFPCDLCHEELTDGHEMAWAKRMICGYCSLEQAIAQSCSGCGKRLTTTAAQPEGRKTRFWEGGKGCRDQSKLDPRDKHKYRNKSKTISRRAHRLAAASKS